MLCSHCNATNMENANFCVNCGVPLGEIQKERALQNLLSFKKASLLKVLLNPSFNEFITLKIIKFLYFLSILSGGIAALMIIIIGFHASSGFGIFALLIAAPLVFLLTIIYSRVFLEMIVAILRIAGQRAESTEELASEKTIRPRENTELKENIQWKI